MDKSLQSKIKLYSSLSLVAIASANKTHAEIIHVEVDYAGGYETYDIDIDGDGVVDFSTIANNVNSSFTYSYNSAPTPITLKLDNISLEAKSGNGLLIAQGVVSFQSYTYPYNYAVALSNGSLINASNSYSFNSTGVLAGKLNVSAEVSGFNVPVANESFGKFGNSSERFVGVQFDIDGALHYGWLRFKDVTQDGSSWTLVDMAYNDEEEGEIETGQTLDIIEKESNLFSVSSSDNSLTILMQDNLIGSQIEVIDLSGKKLFSQKMNSTNEQISHNLPKGVYVVRLFSQDKAITRKISL